MHYAWIIAFTGTLVLVLTQGFGRMSYAVILPSMKKGLMLTYTQAGLIGTANFVGYLILAVIGGIIAVRFGSKRTIFISLIVMGITLFLTGLSDSFTFAFVMRFITGMGNGGAVVPMMALTASWFAQKKRGLASGILTAGTGIGLTFTGLALPFLIGKFGEQGWRYAWFTLGTIVFFFSFLCNAFLKDDPSEKGLSMYGGEERVATCKHSTIFSLWGDVVREKEVWKLGFVYFMFGFSYIIFMTFFVAYLTHEVGLPPQKAGNIFALLGLFSIGSGIIWGWLSDILGRRMGLFLSYITLSIPCVILILSRDTIAFYASSIIFGISLSSVATIMAAAAGDVTGKRLAPATLGFVTLLFGIGQSISPAVAGWIKDITGTFIGSFALSASASIIGALSSLMLKRG
ncbi:MAG: MFS transporter [Syntrophorhabdaceae bacterium]|nr:MFS transporter [Syntrophorhabdaceae bacterium]